MAGATCAAGASASYVSTATAGLVSLLVSLWAQVRHQLNNDFIGGSVALAVASALAGLAWRAVHAVRAALYDRVFSTYDIPPGSPQYFAALRWLHQQSAVKRASHRLVVNPVSAPDSHDADSGGDGMSHDLHDPLELGLHTVPMLLRDQSLCVRVGASLVWVGHGAGAWCDRMGGVSGGGGLGGDRWGGMGAIGGGGGRGSWYQQLLSGARGDVGLAHASAFGWAGSGAGSSDGFSSGGIRLHILGRDGEATLRAILELGRRLGRGAARRFTQVYIPSSAMGSARGSSGSGGMGAGSGGGWIRPEWVDAGRKPARPISSVILRGTEAQDLLDDARAFLSLERWYAERGIPYRRGYLLHGVPGSGKTSLVCAIAGELQLPIYMLRLSGAGLDDEAFHRLLAGTARRAVVLLEDVDAAAGAAVGTTSAPAQPPRESATKGGSAHSWLSSGGGSGGVGSYGDSRLTLPGLLNALDGVGAVDGRLLFMTCQRADALEPALVRPGRIDRRLRFGPPHPTQAEALFCHFYGGSGLPFLRPSRRPEPEPVTEDDASDDASYEGKEEDEEGDEVVVRRKVKETRRHVAIGGAPPPVNPEALRALARKFAAAAVGVRAEAGSMAALQGHLMMYRDDPEGAVENASVLRDTVT